MCVIEVLKSEEVPKWIHDLLEFTTFQCFLELPYYLGEQKWKILAKPIWDDMLELVGSWVPRVLGTVSCEHAFQVLSNSSKANGKLLRAGLANQMAVSIRSLIKEFEGDFEHVELTGQDYAMGSSLHARHIVQ